MDGRVAFITGAGKGQGRSHANLVEKTGRRMIARHADVRDRKALQAAFDDGVEEFGYIDTVVANAGILLNRVDEPDPEAAWDLGIGVMLPACGTRCRSRAPTCRSPIVAVPSSPPVRWPGSRR
jgi:NAD(P)-dependent dehydrogenase (short-subunit alcohol dehydrogenase family)